MNQDTFQQFVIEKLNSIDDRLHNVEIDVAKLQERKKIFESWREWLSVAIAIVAVLVAWLKSYNFNRTSLESMIIQERFIVLSYLLIAPIWNTYSLYSLCADCRTGVIRATLFKNDDYIKLSSKTFV